VGFCDGQKWRWGRFSPRTWVSPASLHSICFSTIIFTITRGWHNSPGVAAVPIAPQSRINKKKLRLLFVFDLTVVWRFSSRAMEFTLAGHGVGTRHRQAGRILHRVMKSCIWAAAQVKSFHGCRRENSILMRVNSRCGVEGSWEVKVKVKFQTAKCCCTRVSIWIARRLLPVRLKDPEVYCWLFYSVVFLFASFVGTTVRKCHKPW
jgi:hypothetical protein